MSGPRRCTPAKQILELTRQLAEDYASVPLPEVSRVVRNAGTASTDSRIDRLGARATGPAAVAQVEQVARGDLDGLTARQPRPDLTPKPPAAAPRAARPHARHRGAA
jgi:hypothetical protein